MHRSDGYYFLLPGNDSLGRRQLSVAEMIVGQGLALAYLDPRTLEKGAVITREHLNVDPAKDLGVINLDQKLQQGQDLAEVMSSIEAYLVSRALERNRGNRHQAAKLLGLDLATFERKLEDYGLTGQ